MSLANIGSNAVPNPVTGLDLMTESGIYAEEKR
jgi:hypothetical protein